MFVLWNAVLYLLILSLQISTVPQIQPSISAGKCYINLDLYIYENETGSNNEFKQLS